MQTDYYLDSVFYDHKSNGQFLNSEPILKKAIKLDFLTNPRRKVKKINSYRLSKFKNRDFIINIHKRKEDFEYVQELLTNYKKHKNIKFLCERTGMNYNEYGYIHFDQLSLIEIRVNKYFNKVLKKEKEHKLRYDIAKYYLWEELSPKDISVKTGLGIIKVKNIIWSLKYNKSSLSDTILTKKHQSDILLCQNYKLILKQFSSKNFCKKSLNEQYLMFIDNNVDYNIISFKKFTWFCKDIMGMKYSKINRLNQYCDSSDLKRSRYLISLLLLEFMRKDVDMMFYDSSIICENNYKNKVWTFQTGQNSKTYHPQNKIFGSASILMACTTKQIINYWITKKTNKLVTTSFLYETILKYRNMYRNKVLVIFLDNATIHYSTEIKLLSQKLGVYLFFNAPYSSKINLIEYVFEKIKRGIRQKLTKQKNTNLKDILFKQTIHYINNSSKIETGQFYKELHYALQLRNMWIQDQIKILDQKNEE